MGKLKVLVVTLVSIVIFYILLRSIIYRGELPGNPTGEPAFIILNPLRDKNPEITAEFFLQKLKEDKCNNAITEIPNQQSITSICEKEKRYPLVSWELANRTDDSKKIRLYYEVKRKNYPLPFGQLWIIIEKTEGNWKVSNYECWY